MAPTHPSPTLEGTTGAQTGGDVNLFSVNLTPSFSHRSTRTIRGGRRFRRGAVTPRWFRSKRSDQAREGLELGQQPSDGFLERKASRFLCFHPVGFGTCVCSFLPDRVNMCVDIVEHVQLMMYIEC